MRKGNPQRRKAGFTIVEMLMTTLILLMVTAIVAAGIPTAVNAYKKVLDAANSQLLLSTTISRLEEELSTAVEIWTDTDNKTLTSYSHYRESYKITPTIDTTEGVILKYEKHKTTDTIKLPVSSEDSTKNEIALVTGKTETASFYVTYDSIEYDSTNNLFTVNNLKVLKVGEAEETDSDIKRETLVIRPVKTPDVNPDYS